jgi:hypothetical protein
MEGIQTSLDGLRLPARTNLVTSAELQRAGVPRSGVAAGGAHRSTSLLANQKQLLGGNEEITAYPRGGVRRTDHGDDEVDEEGVALGHDGDGEGGEDLLGGLEAAEEPNDAQGAEDADGEVEGAQDDEGHGDDEGVEDGPGVGEEGPQPVGEEVAEQLEGEDDGETDVEEVENALDAGGRAVRELEPRRIDLRLGDGDDEVLRIGGIIKLWPASVLGCGSSSSSAMHARNNEACNASSNCIDNEDDIKSHPNYEE